MIRIQKIISIFIFAVAINIPIKAQSLQFKFLFGEETIEPGSRYFIEELNDSIRIDQLKFYISDIDFYQNDSLKKRLKQRHFLIDLADSASHFIKFSEEIKSTFNVIKFNLGIDSITNVSGAYGGDLDPTKGMYWTWQSGYINYKLEGHSKNSNHHFTYHIGGYQQPFYAIQQVAVEISDSEAPIITINLSNLLEGIELQDQHQIMSPGKRAMLFAEKLPLLFEK